MKLTFGLSMSQNSSSIPSHSIGQKIAHWKRIYCCQNTKDLPKPQNTNLIQSLIPKHAFDQSGSWKTDTLSNFFFFAVADIRPLKTRRDNIHHSFF